MQLGRARAFAVPCAVVLLCVSLGCNSSKKGVPAANTIYSEANENFEQEAYDVAIERFRQFLDHYPIDPRSQEVEFRIAQSHYLSGSYPEAIVAFSDFRRMYPTSERLPEVEYTIGQSYMDQMDDVDRDLSAARNAHDHFRDVILRYTGSEYAGRASAQLRECREHLAERQLYIAGFYFSREKHRAGESRIHAILERFPDTSAAIEAMSQLAASAEREGDSELAGLARTAAEESLEEGGGSLDAMGRVYPPSGSGFAALRRALRERVARPVHDKLAPAGG